jgi:hypothetical protein
MRKVLVKAKRMAGPVPTAGAPLPAVPLGVSADEATAQLQQHQPLMMSGSDDGPALFATQTLADNWEESDDDEAAEKQAERDRYLAAAADDAALDAQREAAAAARAKAEKRKKKGDGKGGKGPKLSKALSDLVIVNATHFHSFDEDLVLPLQHFEINSFTESKSHKWTEERGTMAQYIENTRRRLSRVYPSGARINSSNYHPQPHWSAGAQMVALNWQTTGSYELRFNKGRFHDNGNCGYLLKPDYLRLPRLRIPYAIAPPTAAAACSAASVSGTPPPPKGSAPATAAASRSATADAEVPAAPTYTRVTVEILSAFGLPKPMRADRGDIVDPYVSVALEGPGCISGESPQHTPHIDNNGYHPVWRGMANAKSFTFHTTAPEMCTLAVRVIDKDVAGSDNDLADCFVSLGLLRRGIRCLPLTGAQLGERLESAFVMAMISVADNVTL